MAADSNMGFHQGMVSYLYNPHVLSFQSGAINSSAQMIPGVMSSSGGMNNIEGMVFGSNPSGMSNTAAMIPVGNSAGNLLDPVLGFKHDMGLAVDWSFEEQSILEDGLVKYADESHIMKYIKIAAMLRDKTVRDVALRCRWMTKKENGKRRKPEEYYSGKKMKDRKDKLVDSSSKANATLAQPANTAPFSLMMQHMDSNNRISCEAVDCATRHLLEENCQVLSQIRSNLTTMKLQDNVDLFYRTRDNLTAILNSMSEMPGIMSQMPPLSVKVDEDLINTILPRSTLALMFDTPRGGIHLKQEPRN